MYAIDKGLQFIKPNGILHRDFKLQNLLVDGNDFIQIGDFGLFCLLSGPLLHKYGVVLDPWKLSDKSNSNS